jgi:TM2 domain-containing membrane protein YozV
MDYSFWGFVITLISLILTVVFFLIDRHSLKKMIFGLASQINKSKGRLWSDLTEKEKWEFSKKAAEAINIKAGYGN